METPVASILWFVLILALIPAALWMMKRLPIVKASQTSSARVVGSLALSGSQRLLTVEVGQGEERRWLVLGVTPSSISLLHSMPPQADAPPDQASPSFAETLKHLKSGLKGEPKGQP